MPLADKMKRTRDDLMRDIERSHTCDALMAVFVSDEATSNIWIAHTRVRGWVINFEISPNEFSFISIYYCPYCGEYLYGSAA